MAGSVEFELLATKLDNKDTFGKSDPLLQIYKLNSKKEWQLVHQTETIDNNLNPKWTPFRLTTTELCDNNHRLPLKFECYDEDKGNKNDLIGTFETTFEEIISTPVLKKEFIHPKKKAKKASYKNSGVLTFARVDFTKAHDIQEFLSSGLEMSHTIGLDFSGKNGDSSSPDALHYFVPGQENTFMKAIKSLQPLFEKDFSVKDYGIFAFGMKDEENQVSHHQNLAMISEAGNTNSVSGLMDVYANVVSKCKPHTHSSFSFLINDVASLAHQSKLEGNQVYHVLFMFTDGGITDTGDAQRAIVEASHVPMSVVLIGLGDGPFKEMEMLDGNTRALSARGSDMDRDIVQFIKFKDYIDKPDQMSLDIFNELSRQVEVYMFNNGIEPSALQSE